MNFDYYKQESEITMQNMFHDQVIHPDPIIDPTSFVDRKFELEFLYNYLSNGMSCQVVGPYGYGKTSLLSYTKLLEQQKGDSEYSIAYINPRFCQTSKELWNQTWVSWVDVNEDFSQPIEQHHRIQIPTKYIRQWARYGRRPVLYLDDFEQIVLRSKDFTSNFFLDLQALMQQGIPIVTASRHPVSELTSSNSPASLLLNSFALLRLGPLSLEDARNFIMNQRHSEALAFSQDELETIIELAEGSPLMLQIGGLQVMEARRNGTSLHVAVEAARKELQLLQIEAELEDLQIQHTYSQIRKSTGEKVEKILQAVLESYGYVCKRNLLIGRGEGLRNRADIAAERYGQSYLLSIKWQWMPGSAEQKIPFEVISLIDAIKRSGGEYRRAYLILGGDGWRLLDFYTRGGLGEYIRDIELVNIVTFQQFLEVIKRGEL